MAEEPPTKRAVSLSEGYRRQFTAAFDGLVAELTEEGVKNPEISDGIQHLEEVNSLGTIDEVS